MNRKILFPALISSLAAMFTMLLSGCGFAASSPEYIGLSEARRIALDDARISEADVRWHDREFDLDVGTPVYELEFRANGYKYEYNVHAVTGAVLDRSAERTG